LILISLQIPHESGPGWWHPGARNAIYQSDTRTLIKPRSAVGPVVVIIVVVNVTYGNVVTMTDIGAPVGVVLVVIVIGTGTKTGVVGIWFVDVK
jgi:hypothetical protein